MTEGEDKKNLHEEEITRRKKKGLYREISGCPYPTLQGCSVRGERKSNINPKTREEDDGSKKQALDINQAQDRGGGSESKSIKSRK